jgi:group II intron reverse transcriptase/maturase
MSILNLRYAEYYNRQKIHDNLYKDSKNNASFEKISNLIIYPDNILLAFRIMKSNSGSNTPGEDKLTIKDLKKLNEQEIINKIQSMYSNYMPRKIRRVYIPKSNSEKRPLGIPSIWDRLLQQCIKNILEPICEAKFHHHSFGFRPNRSCEHAIACLNTKINLSQMLYCVDIDIKSFFDKIDHNKLIKQLWALGIHDKKLISIIKCMLKAEIVNEGFPSEGTPQGSILSPLLANVYLNELDWWISNQWETFKTKKDYTSSVITNNGSYFKCKSNRNRSLRNLANLKEGYIIRYADDFKVICKTQDHAERFYHAIKSHLKLTLKLDINEEKSKVIDLTKTYSEFLGFKIRAIKKATQKFGKNSYVAYTNLSDKSINKILEQARTTIRQFKHIKSNEHAFKIGWKWNLQVLGWHNYYKIATHVSDSFNIIHFKLLRFIENSCKERLSKDGNKLLLESNMFKNYKKSKQIRYIDKYYPMLPIGYIQHKNPMNLKSNICNYTLEGRKELVKSLNYDVSAEISKLIKRFDEHNTIEYFDNRISKYSMQLGKCAILNEFLTAEEIHCHHILSKQQGGDDNFKNLVVIHEDVHRLVHMTTEEKLDYYLNKLKVNQEQLDKINKYRQILQLPNIINL